MSSKTTITCTMHIPSQTIHPNKLRIITVLVMGGNDDYAAYTGEGEPEWVADHGDKLSYKEACMAFPMQKLEADRYRR